MLVHIDAILAIVYLYTKSKSVPACTFTSLFQNTPLKFNISPLRDDGWKTIRLPIGKVTFQGKTVKLWEWCKQELQVIAGNKAASALIWDAMATWELFGRIPEALNHCKMIHVPKKLARQLEPGQLRPISVLSIWWRVWSACWLASSYIR